MIDLANMLLSLIAGLAVGLIFFGGLWWTVRKGLTAKQPAIWFVVSQIVRVGFALVVFYFVGVGNWQRMLLCLAGFIAARAIVTYLTRSDSALDQSESSKKQEANHASQSG